MEEKNITPKEVFGTLEARFRQNKAIEFNLNSRLHFTLKDQEKGDYLYTVAVQEGNLEVKEGLVGEATCTVKTKAQTYVEINLGKTNPHMAIMLGKIKVSNLAEMVKFAQLFDKFTIDYVTDNQ